MTATCDYDVTVVGGSIAGCTAAILLGRAGARVAVLERHNDPAAYKTVCTHYIQAGATPTIERLGLAEKIEAAGGVRNGYEAWTDVGWIRPAPGPDFRYPAYGYDIRREKLDPMMRDLASSTPGVDLMMGQTVTGLRASNGRPSGVRAVDRGRREREITSAVVVAADGRDSGVGRMAGVPSRVLPHGRFVYFAYYRGLPLVTRDRSLVWFIDPDVGYAFPQDDGVTLMAAFPTKDRLSWFKRDLEANFEAFFDRLPNAPDLRAGERVSKIIGKLEMPNTVRPAARPGLAFVGDAAMAADPLWGVGCGFAFQSAEWLAQELAPALGSSEAELDAALERYRKGHRRRLLGHWLIMSSYATGRKLNPFERALLHSASRDERARNLFWAFGTRAITTQDSDFARLVGRATRLALTPRERGEPIEAPLPAVITSQRVCIDGVTVPISLAGPEDSEEAVIFVHGNPGSRRDWNDLISRIAPFARAIALDMPGFGRAEKPADFDYTVEGYGRFLGSALDELGVERGHLVLHDFGGPWGLECAARSPDRLASAVLINTGVLLDYKWHYLARIWRTPGLGEAFQASTTRSGFRTALRHGNPRGLPRPFVDQMFDGVDRRTSRAILRLYRATNDPSAIGRRHATALRPLDRPALVIWGAHDPYLPVALAERQRKAFPSATIEILADSGHWPFADNPDSVGRLIEQFLRTVCDTKTPAIAG